jgi:WD40 repeat protein
MRPNLQLVRTYQGHQGPVYSLHASPRIGYFLSCGSDGLVAEWDMSNGEGQSLVQCPGAVFSFSLLPGTSLVAAGTQGGLVCFADLASRKVLRTWEAHPKGVFDFLPLPDGQLLSSGADGSLSLWDISSLEALRRIQLSKTSVRTMVALPNGHLAVGSSDGQIQILDTQFRSVMHWQAHSLSVFRLLWQPEVEVLWSVGRDAQLHCWTLAGEPERVATSAAHLYAINDVVKVPDQDWLVTASMDKTLKVWQLDPLQLLRVADRQRQGVHAYGVNRLLVMGDRLLSCSDDKQIMEWEWVSGGELPQQ